MSSTNQPKHSNKLTIWICIGIVAAILFAKVAPQTAMQFKIGGTIFLTLLKMLVVPLVISSVMSGILGMGDIRKLGIPGGAAVGYYLVTTLMAVVLGVVVVNVIQPGKGMDGKKEIAAAVESNEKLNLKKNATVLRKKLSEETGLTEEEVGAAFPELKIKPKPTINDILKNMVLMVFTDNLLKSASETNLLPLIVFSMVFAGMLTTMGERVDNITRLIEQANHALMAFVMLLMKVAPLGIFCLVTHQFGKAFANENVMEILAKLGKYVAAVSIGLTIHGLVTLPLIYWIFTRKNPYRYLWDISQAMLTAVSTGSSTATLPVTLECVTENAGVSQKSADFVLPLGATINMDGTALYEAVAVIFIAQALGISLSMEEQIVIVLTATIAAIGAAGIPEAGLFTMVIVLNAVGLPIEATALILVVDWFLDRLRTSVNVFGDAVGAAVVEKTLPAET
ncbi:Proton/glutamate symport protein @ Sodium/glutamate symport protein [hydrothermal vent metagenome]|uniref:Proton/glutamate symport protein @ Sodium/glutamate symport protein n=1 Tax=hydrothermal vent metagenome TaxID=652676 RepID=A0A3B1DDK8_9ZZZZ